MNLLIASCPRSGSTMLANIMTVPGELVVLHDPGVYGKLMSFCKVQIRSLGYRGPFCSKEVMRWVDRKYKKWGVKETECSRIRQTYHLMSPERVIVLVRNPAHIAMSMWERAKHLNSPPDSRISWIVKAANEVCDTFERRDDAILVRYESLVGMPEYIDTIGMITGYKMSGDPTIGFDDPRPRHDRTYEVNRNESMVSGGSYSLRKQQEQEKTDIANYGRKVAAKCGRYQEMFGYEGMCE